MRVAGLLGWLLCAGACASGYGRSADREGNAIAAEKMAVVDAFRSDLLRPEEAAGEAAAPAAPPIDVPATVTLEDALRIATAHNRDYRTQEEAFFLSALGLSLTRRNFREPIFSGALSWSGSDGRSVELAESTVLSLSGTQLLPTGGTVTATSTGSLGTSDAEGDRVQDAAMSGTVTLSQPLLRGAFHGVAFEPLKLAERGVVYAARDFEQFRQRFSIQVIGQYYGLVSQKIALKNTERRVENQEVALRQARSLYRLELGPQADVLRAEQTYRSAQNDLLDARQGYALALDRFKIQLGLPLDADFDVSDEIPPVDPLEVDVRGAVEAALHNRLDLLTVRDQMEDSRRAVDVARNALLPDLDVDLSYSIFSDTDMSSFRNLSFDSDAVSLGVTLGLPLDRKAERNALRTAMINVDRARRSRDLAEDNVILEVRDSLRRLRQLEVQIENDQANIQTIERRVRRAVLDNLAGVGSNRDIVEATDDLTAAQNGLLGRFVEHLTTRLQLLQQMGLLFVDKQGRIVE